MKTESRHIRVNGIVYNAAWSPDGKYLAAVSLVNHDNGILGVIGRKPVNIHVYILDVKGSVKSEVRLGSLGEESPPRIAWSPNPSLFAVYTPKRLYIVEYKDGFLRVRWVKDMIRVFAHRGDRIDRVSWNEKGEVVVRTEQAVVYGFNASDGSLEWRRRSGLGRILSSILRASRSLGFKVETTLSPSGNYLIVTMDSYIQLSTPGNGKAWGRDLGGPVDCVSWSPREDMFALCTIIGSISWIVTMDIHGHEVWRRRIGKAVVKGVSWSANGARIAVYSDNGEKGRLMAFSREGELLWEATSRSEVEHLIWDSSGEFLAATGRGGIEVYNGSETLVTESAT